MSSCRTSWALGCFPYSNYLYFEHAQLYFHCTFYFPVSFPNPYLNPYFHQLTIMFLPTTAFVLLAASLTSAAPLAKRIAYPAPPGGDGTILNYALTLEYLERKFYMEGLANYTHADFVAAGFADPFYTNLQEIYYDEQTHVAFLAGALKAAGITPTVELQYCFPATDPLSFVTLSSVLEGVGVSAYLGAAASIMDKDYLTAAGAILTVESRHSSYIRSELKESPFPFPFDTPLDFVRVRYRGCMYLC